VSTWQHIGAWMIPFAVGALAWVLFGVGMFPVGFVVGLVPPFGFAYWLLGDRW
jgi:hypothetical protein